MRIKRQNSSLPKQWRHGSTHSSPRYYIKVSGQLHGSAAFTPVTTWQYFRCAPQTVCTRCRREISRSLIRIKFRTRLRKTLGRRRDAVTESQRELRHKELHSLQTSPNDTTITKPKRMIRTWHRARRGENKTRTAFWWENLRERNRLENLDVDATIKLQVKWV